MSDNSLTGLIENLFKEFADLDDVWQSSTRPLLAHYSSIGTVENILKSEEIWLSNPLFMNDLEELRFGITAGSRALHDADLESMLDINNNEAHDVIKSFNYYHENFDKTHTLDIYVSCFSEHEPEDVDGRLSMWRAYGANGDGAAIVLDSNKINQLDDSPLIVAKVRYATSTDRENWYRSKINQWTTYCKSNDIRGEYLCASTHYLLQCFLLYALTSKHIGFSEEKEWRIIYLPDRDHEKLLEDRLSYIVSARGIEPKLKLPIKPIVGVTPDGVSLSNLVHQLVLGPTLSSELARRSFLRMLEKIGKPYLIDRVITSSIPLRPLTSTAR